MLHTILPTASYLITALAFYKMAQLRNLPSPWMAFIPFLNLYIIGYIGDTLKYNTAPFNRYLADIPLAYALPLLSIGGSLVSGLIFGIGPMLGMIVNLILVVAQAVVYLFIFTQYAPKNKYLFTALSLIPLVGPCLLLYVTREYHY